MSDAQPEREASIATTSVTVAFLLLAFVASRVFALVFAARIQPFQTAAAFGADLVVVAVLGLAVRAVPRPVLQRAIAGGLLAALGAYLVMNAASLRLTGVALSWSTLRGDEGVTLADLGLISAGPLVAGLTALALVVVAAIAAVARGHHIAPRRAGEVAIVCALALGGLALARVGRAAGHPIAFDQNPLVGFAAGMFVDDAAPGRPLSAEEWAQLEKARTPVVEQAPPPAVTGAPPKNAIIWFAEGISRKHTTLGGSPIDTTPHLKRRADQAGLEFTRWYAPYHKSIHALFSLACSEYPPPYHRAMTAVKPRVDCGSLMESLDRAGFKQGLFHGGLFSFSDKLGLLGGRGFDVTVDAIDLEERTRISYKWGVDDRLVVDRLLAWIDSLPKDERFFALGVPISPHYPRQLPKDVERLVPGDDDPAKFKSGVRFSDDVFERLMKGLEQRGLLADTLVLFVADHGEHVEEPPRPSLGARQAYEQNLHVPAVMFHPRLFPVRAQTDRLASHLDLAPTLLSVLGVAGDARHRGQSLFAPDYVQKRLFVSAYQSAAATVGFIDGFDKVLWNSKTGRVELYDIAKDPDELTDLSELRPDVAAAGAVDAERFRGGQLARLDSYPVLDEEPLEQQVFAALGFELVDGASTIRCDEAPGADGRRRCSSAADASIGVARVRVAGRPRDCIDVDVPAQGAVRLSLRGAAVTRMTSVRAALPDVVPKSDARVRFEGYAASRSVGKESLAPKAGEKTLFVPEVARAQQEFVLELQSDVAVPVCVVLSESSWL